MKETQESVCTWECTVQCPCMCLFVCVSEMDSPWLESINSLPDWFQLSGNVTGEPERDLIAIRELPPSSRGQRARRGSAPRKHPSLCEHWTGPQLSSGWELLVSQGVFNRCVAEGCGQTRWPAELDQYHTIILLCWHSCLIIPGQRVQFLWECAFVCWGKCTSRGNTAGVSPAASCGKLFLLRRRCEVAERSTDDLWSSDTTDSPERER